MSADKKVEAALSISGSEFNLPFHDICTFTSFYSLPKEILISRFSNADGICRSSRHSSNESGREKFLSDLTRCQICRDKSVIFVPLSEDLPLQRKGDFKEINPEKFIWQM